MKKGFFLAPAAVLLHHHGAAYAAPVVGGAHPAEVHHAAIAHGVQQPDILKYMTGPHQDVIVTEALHSQKAAIAALAKNKGVSRVNILHTGTIGKPESTQARMHSVHHYLMEAGVDPKKIVHSAVKPHRDNILSHEKYLVKHTYTDLKLHNWEEEGHNLIEQGKPVNMHVLANVPAETVIHSIDTAKKVGGEVGLVHHHDSGAAFRNDAKKEYEDKEAIGKAVHNAKGHLVWTHRDHSWPKPGSAMTQPSSKLKEFNPLDHVKSAEDSSTFPHNKAIAVDKIGKAVLGNAHIPAIREEKWTGKDESGKRVVQESDYKDTFDPLRKSEKKDGEAGKDLDFIEKVWLGPAKSMLKKAQEKALEDGDFAKNKASPEMIAKHLSHISNHDELIGSLKKPGMQVEYLDAHNQGALAEAAHNKEGSPHKGAYFVPVKHVIAGDKRVVTEKLDHVDPKEPTHWQMINGDVNTAFDNLKAMHQGKHEELFKKLAENSEGESKNKASSSDE